MSLRPKKPKAQRAWNSTLPASRKELSRGKGLKPGGKPKRGRALPRRNAKRLARLEKRNFGRHGDHIRGQRCHNCHRPPRSQASHARDRGHGGCGGDRRELFPQCWKCHRLFELGRLLNRDGTPFTRDQARAVAAEYWRESPYNDDTPETDHAA